ncbi:MAG: cobalt ECF transporter T component CbiQ [Oligoflexia bacterium]|nr:cobalt ECF transporter T component CbiQ [Oligoflexia bacterium]
MISNSMKLISDQSYNSSWRFIHPMEKIIFVSLAMLSSLIAKSPYPPLIVALITTIIAITLAKIKLGLLGKLLTVPLGFVLIGSLTILLTFSKTDTDIVAHQIIPLIKVTKHYQISLFYPGIFLVIKIIANFLGCATSLLLLILTTPITDIIYFLKIIKIPNLLLELLILSYRAIFILLDTCSKIYTAQSSRLGYNGVISSFRSFASLTFGILTKSLKRTHTSWLCMLSRGYQDEIDLLSFDHRVSIRNLIIATSIGLLFLFLSIKTLPISFGA